MMKRRVFLRLAGLTLGGLFWNGLQPVERVLAKEVYPAERITWIVPVKPGGGFDIAARFLSPRLPGIFKELNPGAKGGDIVIKNIAEAGGRRAYSNLFNAKPNGYTIGDFNLGFVTETLTDKVEFDFNKFTFLLRTGVSVRVIATRKDGFRNWEEMVKAAKEKEIKWAAGNFGRGAHIDSILAKEAMGIPAKLINFPGTAENSNAVLRGDVQVGLFSLDSIQGLLNAKEFRPLVVFDKKSDYPGVPSIKDLGYPELADTICYHRYIIGPPGVPREIGNAIIAAFKKVLSHKEVMEWAERNEFKLDSLFGDESEKVARKVMNYYVKMTPTLLKYIK
ncbi:MAG: Bug family tripartite tricarboxylate transporter substrate binding protein [Thermodesulfobacteriota bacterium]